MEEGKRGGYLAPRFGFGHPFLIPEVPIHDPSPFVFLGFLFGLFGLPQGLPFFTGGYFLPIDLKTRRQLLAWLFGGLESASCDLRCLDSFLWRGLLWGTTHRSL